jgi:hypothetical protein
MLDKLRKRVHELFVEIETQRNNLFNTDKGSYYILYFVIVLAGLFVNDWLLKKFPETGGGIMKILGILAPVFILLAWCVLDYRRSRREKNSNFWGAWGTTAILLIVNYMIFFEWHFQAVKSKDLLNSTRTKDINQILILSNQLYKANVTSNTYFTSNFRFRLLVQWGQDEFFKSNYFESAQLLKMGFDAQEELDPQWWTKKQLWSGYYPYYLADCLLITNSPQVGQPAHISPKFFEDELERFTVDFSKRTGASRKQVLEFERQQLELIESQLPTNVIPLVQHDIDLTRFYVTNVTIP